MLSETWLKKEGPNIKGYSFVNKNRLDGYGGVGIYIQHNIQFEIIKTPTLSKIELTGIKTKNTKDILTIISVYIPPNIPIKLLLEDFNTLFNYIQNIENLIMGGDFNCHSLLCGSDKECYRGKKLDKYITKSNMMNLNNGDPTFVPPYGKKPSVLDITMVSPYLYDKIKWEVLDENLKSDHLVILMTLENQSKHILCKRREKIDIKIFSGIMATKFSDDINDINELTKEILTAKDQSIIGKKGEYMYVSNRTPKSWWNGYLTDLYEEKAQNVAKYNRIVRGKDHQYFDDDQNEITQFEALQIINLKVNKSTAKLQKEIKEAKKTSWRTLTSSITPDITPTKMWNIIKKFQGSNNIPKDLIRNDKEMSQKFMNNCFKENDETTFDVYKSNNKVNYPDYDKDFTINEFQKMLKKKKNTAPGIDGISYEMLKAIPVGLQEKMVKIFNDLWKKNEIPEDWKTFDVIPILKPNKNANDFLFYRPIVLISTRAKSMNNLVKNRLNEFVEKNNILHPNSYGFRNNRSTTNCVNHLVSLINQGWRNKKKVIGIFLDLSKAYDNVNVKKLRDIMDSKMIPATLTNWTINFFINRKIKMKTALEEIEITTSTGLPQGSTLSPLAFNIYTTGIHELNEKNIKIIQYADDLVVLGWNSNLKTLVENLQNKIDEVINCLEDLELKTNGEKSAVIMFGNETKIQPIEININNSITPQKTNQTYLGINIDKKLNFKAHIDNLKAACEKKLNIMKFLSNKTWGAHPDSQLKIYKAMIRSKLDYGASIFGDAAKTNLHKLDTIQNSALRLALGCLKTTPTNVLLNESGELPLNIRRNWIARKEQIKMNHQKALPKIISKIPEELNHKKYTFFEKQKCKLKQVNKQINTIYLKKVDKPKNLTIKSEIIFNNKPIKKSDWKEPELYKIVNQDISENYDNWNKYFTDGSKGTEGVGFAAYSSNNNIAVMGKLNDNFCIMNAELAAICAAVKEAGKSNYTFNVILTDSKASLQSMMKNVDKETNYIIQEIFHEILTHQQKVFVFQWIPSHIGISGNEIADDKAKIASQLDNCLRWKLTKDDALNLIEKNILDEAEEVFKETIKTKGKNYIHINKNMNKKPWFHKLKFDSKEIKVLSRLRSGHGMCKKKKFQFGLETNDLCETCNVTEDLEHTIFKCKKFYNERTKFSIFSEFHNLNDILKVINIKNYRQLVKFTLKVMPDI